MMAGRPRTLRLIRQKKVCFTAGRYKERLQRVLAKKQKLQTLESLVAMYEAQPKRNMTYIRDLKRKANEVRAQLRVLSTVAQAERP